MLLHLRRHQLHALLIGRRQPAPPPQRNAALQQQLWRLASEGASSHRDVEDVRQEGPSALQLLSRHRQVYRRRGTLGGWEAVSVAERLSFLEIQQLYIKELKQAAALHKHLFNYTRARPIRPRPHPQSPSPSSLHTLQMNSLPLLDMAPSITTRSVAFFSCTVRPSSSSCVAGAEMASMLPPPPLPPPALQTRFCSAALGG